MHHRQFALVVLVILFLGCGTSSKSKNSVANKSGPSSKTTALPTPGVSEKTAESEGGEKTETIALPRIESPPVTVKKKSRLIEIPADLNIGPEAAIAYFKKLKGKITVDETSPDKPVIGLSLDLSDVTDAELVYLKGLAELQNLDLSGTKITDAGLVHLTGLTKLQELRLSSTKITDDGLEQLKGLSQLQKLYLSNNKITDDGLVHLEGLTSLIKLYLGGTKVTGKGLVHLSGLTELQWLDLMNTEVTEKGLVHLKGLVKLQKLYLYGTKVSPEGIRKLQKALPNCEIKK